jgi:hypothetical protein
MYEVKYLHFRDMTSSQWSSKCLFLWLKVHMYAHTYVHRYTFYRPTFSVVNQSKPVYIHFVGSQCYKRRI